MPLALAQTLNPKPHLATGGRRRRRQPATAPAAEHSAPGAGAAAAAAAGRAGGRGRKSTAAAGRRKQQGMPRRRGAAVWGVGGGGRRPGTLSRLRAHAAGAAVPAHGCRHVMQARPCCCPMDACSSAFHVGSFAGRASEPLTILMVVLHITFHCEFMECGSRWLL